MFPQRRLLRYHFLDEEGWMREWTKDTYFWQWLSSSATHICWWSPTHGGKIRLYLQTNLGCSYVFLKSIILSYVSLWRDETMHTKTVSWEQMWRLCHNIYLGQQMVKLFVNKGIQGNMSWGQRLFPTVFNLISYRHHESCPIHNLI